MIEGQRHLTAIQSQFKLSKQIFALGSQQSTLMNFKKSLDSTNKRRPHVPSLLQMASGSQIGGKSAQKIRKVSIDRRITKPTTRMPTMHNIKSTTGIAHDPVRISDFKQLHKIGQGSYSSVKVFQKENSKYACKIFKKPLAPQILENVRSQIDILRKVTHDNIVQLHYTFEDTNHLYIVLQYVQGKTLAGFLKKTPTQEQVKNIARQLVSAIGCLHTNNIAHRDLKLDNVMIDEANNNRVVLIDFGFATNCQRKLKMFCGTPSYMCPQIVKRSWYSGSKADIWALGVILYRMVTGVFPFRGTSQIEVFGKICKSKYDDSKLSHDQSTLLSHLLCKLQSQRYRCSQISSCIWLKTEQQQTAESAVQRNVMSELNLYQ